MRWRSDGKLAASLQKTEDRRQKTEDRRQRTENIDQRRMPRESGGREAGAEKHWPAADATGEWRKGGTLTASPIDDGTEQRPGSTRPATTRAKPIRRGTFGRSGA